MLSSEKKYRDTLREGNKGLFFIYLKGNFDLIAQRLQDRKNHFFKPEMLRSQFEILEEPSNSYNDVYTVDINKSLNEVVFDSINFINKVVGYK